METAISGGTRAGVDPGLPGVGGDGVVGQQDQVGSQLLAPADGDLAVDESIVDAGQDDRAISPRLRAIAMASRPLATRRATSSAKSSRSRQVTKPSSMARLTPLTIAGRDSAAQASWAAVAQLPP